MRTIIHKKLSSEQSFTLVEILIISAIVVLLSGTMLANYSNFNQQKNLDKEVHKFIDVLSLVKTKAQAADIYYDCSGSDEFGGYTVEIDQSSYNFKQCC